MNAAETLIIKHLDTWTSAIKAKSSVGRGGGRKEEFYGIKKLRELILELALRGLLVPQDPKDEPSSELLKRIATEKAALIKKGKLKKEQHPPNEPTDHPHDLPSVWKWVRFGDIALHNAGKTLDQGRNSGELRDYITTSNLYWGRFDLTDVRQMAIREEELEKCTATEGDLLICEGGEAGRAAVWTQQRDICFQNHIHRARLFGGIDAFFAYRLFEKLSMSGEIENYRKGVGISNMSGKALASVAFPLPPLAEQQRIVAKVDELMVLCDQLEQQQEDSVCTHSTLVQTLLSALTAASERGQFEQAWQRIASHFDTLFTTESSIDQLKQTILQLAVMGKLVEQEAGDEPAARLIKRLRSAVADAGKVPKSQPPIDTETLPFSLPSSWEWVQAQELCRPNNLITYGILKPIWVESGVPTVRVQDMKNGEIDESDLGQCSPERAAKFAKTTLEAGDLLVAKDGATLGKTGFVPATLAGGNITQHVLRFPISELVDRVFIRLVIDSSHGQNWMKGETKGVALPGVNVGDFRRMPIPLPSLAEQHRIVAKVGELMALCDRLKASLQTAQATQLHLADSLVEATIH